MTIPFPSQKISSKNAFGLHLIDHMLKVLQQRGDITNFQVRINGCGLNKPGVDQDSSFIKHRECLSLL